MLGYYLQLALRTLRRNIVLTSLIVAAVGVGIGAYMTILTVLIAMSGDPIHKNPSSCLCHRSMCGVLARDPRVRRGMFGCPLRSPTATPWRSCRLTRQKRQAAMYATGLDVTPGSGAPFSQTGRALIVSSLRCSRYLSSLALHGL